MELNEKLNRKIQSQLIQISREKLNNGPIYKNLTASMKKVIDYSVPSIRFVNGFVEQITPNSIKEMQSQIQQYASMRYPILYNQNVGNRTIQQLFSSVSIWPAQKLKLNQIDYRLTMFNEYLKYKLDAVNVFRDTVYYDCLTFDEWLYVHNYDVLVFIDWDRYVN